MTPKVESRPARLLRGLAHWVNRAPGWFIYPHALLCFACLFYTYQNLQFSTDRNDLVGADKKYHTNFLAFKREFAGQDDLVAVVESETAEKNRQFVERLGARLELETNLFTGVFYKGDLTMMGPKALLFLPETTLGEMREALAENRPFLEQFSTATNLNSLFRQINAQFRASGREENESTTAMIKALPALRRIIDQAAASLARPGQAPSPGISALFDAGEEAEERQYITYDGGRIYLVTARARSQEATEKAVERLGELVRAVQSEVPGVNAGITGEPILEMDEMRQSQRDSIRASVFSLVLVAGIFIFGYREVGRPIKATLSLVAGLIYTLGYATLVVGHLNILTVTFLPILIGLAIDFGVHLITRFEEELAGGETVMAALEKAMVNTGLGIFTGCFTTAGAFFAMGLTDFKGIQEMGIITGGGMLLCLIPMMTLLPALLMKGKKAGEGAKRRKHGQWRANLERAWLNRPGMVLIGAGVLSAFAAPWVSKVYFDYNLLNMQSPRLPSVVFEVKLIDSATKSLLFGAVVADTPEEAVRVEERLRNLSTVAEVDSLAPFLAEDQEGKLEAIRLIRREASAIDFREMDAGLAELGAFNQTLFYTQGYLGMALRTIERGEEALVKELEALRESISNFRYRLSSGDERVLRERLTAYQQALFRDIRETFALLRGQAAEGRLRVEDLPEALRPRFVGATGKYLLMVYPKKNVWERGNQEEFVKEVRTVDPNVTGTPVQLYEYTSLLRESYEKAAWYALGAIALLVWAHFRNLFSVIFSLLPVGIGAFWMLGIMGWLGIPFNPANIMTLPLVIGIGVTNGIHILNRFAEERNPEILGKSTGKAVLVSGLTTLAGFGSLMGAEHQGIASLGAVMSGGVATCMLAGLTCVPALVTWLTRRGWIGARGETEDEVEGAGGGVEV